MGQIRIARRRRRAAQAQASQDPNGAAVVVVTGQRAACVAAEAQAEFRTRWCDSIVADDIGKLPDRW
ncbi:hypothetical protein [Massilia phosphatilytica]